MASISHSHSSDDNVTYQQWVSVDRTQLITQVQSVEEYIAALVIAIDDLTSHHIIAKAQSEFYKKVKKNLTPSQGVIASDFAKNYTFIVQDAIQGYPWTNDQSSLHPFSLYTAEGHSSFCVCFDCLKHSTDAVYVFTEKII